MKNPFFKSMLVVVSALALFSCSEESSTPVSSLSETLGDTSTESGVTSTDACWYLDAGTEYLVYPSGVVTDISGTVVGSITYDETLVGTIVNVSGDVIIENVNLNELTITTQEDVVSGNVNSSSSETSYSLSYDYLSSLSSSSGISIESSSSTLVEGVSSSVDEITSTESSSSTAVVTNGSVTVTGNLTQTVAQGSSTSEIVFTGLTSDPNRTSWNIYFLGISYSDGTYTIKATTVPDYYPTGTATETFEIEGTTYTFTLNVTSASSTTSSSSSSVYSSSSAKSSSSVASSSSYSSSSSVTYSGTSEEIVYVSGGASGSGWATRYWDCCKPSCSWTANAGSGNEAKMCTVSGTVITDESTTSVCNGGTASTCTSQIPIIVNDSLAYAFAAVPASNGGQCGKCFALAFDGTGYYESKNPQASLKGKILIVMASNVGTDVSQGQFDIMIPGGGVGIYNGCSGFGWGDQGSQYGGLLSDCESEVGYSYTGTTLTTKRKECLVEKCNSVFSNDSQAKEGCLFLANWMNAAGNPNHTYQEVECPSALKAAY